MSTNRLQNSINDTIEKLREITKGIDKTESESDDGWWETSKGAEFGKEIQEKIELLIEVAMQ